MCCSYPWQNDWLDAGADCVRTDVSVCFALMEKVEMLSGGSSDGYCTELNDLAVFVHVC